MCKMKRTLKIKNPSGLAGSRRVPPFPGRAAAALQAPCSGGEPDDSFPNLEASEAI